MYRLNLITCVAVFFLFLVIGKAEGIFNQKEMIIIHDKCLQEIKNYERMINTIGQEITDVDLTKGNIEDFINLFVNRKTLIYNDLDPAHLLSEFYEVETYASNLSLWYPDGMLVKLDFNVARASNVIEHGEGIYSMDIVIPKKIDGNYMNRTQNSNNEELLFRVVFFTENAKVGEVKIAGIRNAKGENISFAQTSLDEVKSLDLNEEELDKVRQDARAVINDYINYFNLLGNKEETEEDKAFYREAIMNITSREDNSIFNDLQQEVDDQYVDIENYITEYTTLYPEGINNLSVNTDSADFSKVIRIDDNNFYMYANADKFFSGKVKGKNMYRFQDKLIFKITFTRSNNVFGNFAIAGIDHAGLNETLTAAAEQQQNINDFLKVDKFTRKGLYLTVNGFGGIGQVIDQNLRDITMEEQYHEWKITPDIAYGASFGVNYMFNDLFGIESGLGFHHFKTTYSISSIDNEVDPDLIETGGINAFIDPNLYLVWGTNDVHIRKMLNIPSYDSVIKLNYLNFPVLLSAVMGKSGKICLNIKTGFEFSFLFNSSYFTKGEMEYFVYVSDPNLEIIWDESNNLIRTGYLDIADEKIGLYDRKINIEDKIENIKKVGVNYLLYLGADIPLGYFLSINAGITTKTSLTDISKLSGSYIDIFGLTESDQSNNPNHIWARKPIKASMLVFEIGMKYKF